MKANWLSAIVAPALVLGIATAPPGATAAKSGTNGPYFINSPNFAGYEAVANNKTVESFQYVQATFTVPSLNCTQTPTATVTQEVSLVGNNTAEPEFNNTAELQEKCLGGSPSYQAAWSSGCNGHGDVMPLTITPGDDVELTVHNADITVVDLTTDASASAPLSTTCGANPAAAVFTSSSGTVADFTQVGFHQIQVEASNQSTRRPLVSAGWSIKHYILLGPSGQADVKPEVLLSGKYTSSFASDWLASN